MTPKTNSTYKMAELEAHDALQYNYIYHILGLCVVGYIAWQYFLRTGLLWNPVSEPPMLPYWIPGKAEYT
jgi:hypothetical protein